MRITSVHKNNIREIASNYEDTFEQYNSDVNYLFIESSTKLKDANRRHVEASKNLESVKEKYRQLDKCIDAAKQDLEKTVADKDGEVKSEIARIRDEFVSNSIVYSKKDIAELVDKYNELSRRYVRYKPDFTVEDIMNELAAMSEEDKSKYKALSAIIDNVGSSYGGNVRTDGKFTHKFSTIYRSCQNEVSSDILESDGKTDLTDQQLMDEFAQTYNNGARGIKSKLLGFVFFPKSVFEYLCRRKITMMEYVGGFKDIIKNKLIFSVTGLSYAIPLALWFIILIWILSTGDVGEFIFCFAVLYAMTIAIIKYSDNKLSDYVRKTIIRYMYYRNLFDNLRPTAEKKYQDIIAEEKQKMDDEISRLGNTIKEYNKKNDDAIERAEKEFNIDDIDFSDLEAAYNNKVAQIKKIIADYESKKSQVSNQIEDYRSREEKAASDYNNAYKEVLDFFEQGIEVKKTNGFDNKLVGVESRKFVYHIAYLNLFSLLNNVYMENPLTLTVNGSNLSDLQFKGDFNDLPPRTIPVKLTTIDLRKTLIDSFKCSEKVANDLIKIFMTASIDIENAIKKVCPQYESIYMSSDNLDKFDLRNVYFVNKVKHDNRCSLILYDSSKDKEYVKVISRFIYERLFKATYMTTNPKSARYHFVVQDRTYFDSGNIVLLSRKGGESMETIRDMEASQIYTIVEESEFGNLLKQLRSKRMTEFIDACADMSRNFDHQIDTNIEYLIGTKSRGSVPQCLDYLYVWLDSSKLRNSDLTTILKSTGGSKAEGEQNVVNNPYGVIPFIIMDKAELYKEKPDRSVIEAMKEISSVISYNNFFQIEDNANKLYGLDRNKFISEIDTVLANYSR